MNPPLQRKPRFQRIKNPLNLHVTGRDLEILSHISNHRFLQSHHITQLVSGSEQHLLRRLARLYHSGFIERPRQQLQIEFSYRSTFVYSLSEKGRKFLLSRGLPVSASAPKLRSVGSTFSLMHDLLVSDLLVGLMLSASNNDIGFRLTSEMSGFHDAGQTNFLWRVAIKNPKANSTETTVIPDASFTLSGDSEGSLPNWFFLEFDRGTMPVKRSNPNLTSFDRKVSAYKETRRSGVLWKRYEISGFRILVVTQSQKRMRSLQLATAERFRTGNSTLFLFSTLDLLKQSDPLSDPVWELCSGEEVKLFPERLSTASDLG